MTKNTPTVKIIVATHKKYEMPQDAMYLHCMLAQREKQIRMEIRWI